MTWVTCYPCLEHPAPPSCEHWVITNPGSRPRCLREVDGRHAICSTEGMMHDPLDADSSLAFLTRESVPSASDVTLTVWALLALALVVAVFLIGAR